LEFRAIIFLNCIYIWYSCEAGTVFLNTIYKKFALQRVKDILLIPKA
jgi:hypothetical protein